MQGTKQDTNGSPFPFALIALLISEESTQIASSATDTKFSNFSPIENESWAPSSSAMIKNKVECTDGEFLIPILFASVAQVRAAIAEFVGAISLGGLFSGEMTESALIPAPAAVLV
jgi:hypothetical protein